MHVIESYACYVYTCTLYFQEHHITPHVFGEILYENFLFDIPKIFDLCVLYGEGNGPLLTKIVDNIFTQQPKYNDDLQCAIPTVIQVISVHVERKGFLMIQRNLSKPNLLGISFVFRIHR